MITCQVYGRTAGTKAAEYAFIHTGKAGKTEEMRQCFTKRQTWQDVYKRQDIRIMSETGRIGLPEINLGVFPGSGGLYRLARYVGISRAYELLYTGRIMDAGEALEIGLVNHLAPAGETKKAALELDGVIAEKPVEAIRLIKKGVRELWQKTTAETFRPNLEFSRRVFQTADCAEGVDAFIHKRTPEFGKGGRL